MAIHTFQAHASKLDEIEQAIARCSFEPGLVMAFGNAALLSQLYQSSIKSKFPKSAVCGCTTAGEVAGQEIHDESIVINLYKFGQTHVREHAIAYNSSTDSERVGKELSQSLAAPDLRHIFVLSDGLNINGSSLVDGLRAGLPANVAVTGGLAGDGDRFKETLVLSSSGVAPKKIVGIGFYGTCLQVGFGSMGGWDSFGTDRIITKSTHNVLYEFDNAPALPLYKKYLGELAKDLPSSGLLFPISIRVPGSQEPLVRTLLSVDEGTQSLTLAGDVPEGCQARFMKANIGRLLDGASSAGNIASIALDAFKAEAAILISCVGRRLVLKQRAEEELEAVIEQIGSQASVTGFYSYGEIAPFIKNARCELHNQTMTITVFAER